MKKGSSTGAVKICIDIIMVLMLSVLFKKNLVSMRFHELVGAAMLLVMAVHLILNMKWIKAVTSGIVKGKARLSLQIVLNGALFVFMTAAVITGLMISKTLPTAIGGVFWIKPWHIFFSCMALITAGLHFGMHLRQISEKLYYKAGIKGTSKKAISAVILLLMLMAGGYCVYNTGFMRQLSMPFAGSFRMSEVPQGRGGGQLPDGAPGYEKRDGELEENQRGEGELRGRDEAPEYEKRDGEFEENQHVEGEAPGSGKRDGSGRARGEGKGLGLGKNPGRNEGGHGIAPGGMSQQGISDLGRTVKTATSYAGIFLFFAGLSALLGTAVQSIRNSSRKESFDKESNEEACEAEPNEEFCDAEPNEETCEAEPNEETYDEAPNEEVEK
ncbi:MAG: DUF4405 domain-containing protein [Clostridiales bacterium]|nr:DUF4405 domain-containing protein [Clostridiales bacterium]